MNALERAKQAEEEANKMEAEDQARIDAEEKAREEAAEKSAGESAEPIPVAHDGQPEPKPVVEPAQPETGKTESVDELAKRNAEIERLTAELQKSDQRWKTLQGFRDKQESEKDAQLKALQDKFDALEARLLNPPKPAEKAYLRKLNPDERKAYEDEDSLPAETRAALGELEAARERYTQELDERERRILERVKKEQADIVAKQAQAQEVAATQNRLFAKVEELAPGFAADDSNPNWGKFLDQPDPSDVMGGTYRESAKRAIDAVNARAIASIYAEFKAKDPSGSKAKALEALVRPETTRATGTDKAAAQGKVAYTVDQYKRFYDAYADFARGKPMIGRDGRAMTTEQVEKIRLALDEAESRGELRV
jgi:hypothetical protein